MDARPVAIRREPLLRGADEKPVAGRFVCWLGVVTRRAIVPLRCYYNFVRPHGSLRFGRVTRTPAMQAGLTTRALTLRDIFTWVLRPTQRPLSLTRSM